ncbi:MAG: cyclic nucleotide-binding domain-containing protein [Candidatus Fermentibacteraceae bacterium]|nr:cyclic nucleotide-binding domain-containing protein [Candidatus Fermentibacteraceae bacterium]
MHKKFLDDLTDVERTEFISKCEKKVFLAGTEIVTKDDTSRVMYIIKTGSATASDSWDEDSVPLAIFSEWDVFGEMSFLDGSPRSATVKATEDSVVYSIEWDSFIELIESSPVITTKILLSLVKILINRLQFIDVAFTTIAVANRDMKKIVTEMRRFHKG